MAPQTISRWRGFLSAGKEIHQPERVEGEILRVSPVSLNHEMVLGRLIGDRIAFARGRGISGFSPPARVAAKLSASSRTTLKVAWSRSGLILRSV